MKSTNNCEGFNRKLKDLFICTKPELGKFLGRIKFMDAKDELDESLMQDLEYEIEVG
jgi:hypothetical protein